MSQTISLVHAPLGSGPKQVLEAEGRPLEQHDKKSQKLPKDHGQNVATYEQLQSPSKGTMHQGEL